MTRFSIHRSLLTREITLALTMASTLALSACSGGGDDLYDQNGIESGSISGTFNQSSDLPPELAAALPQTINDDYSAAQFLFRASFGPTEESITELRDAGYIGWLNQQLQLPATFTLPLTRQHNPPRPGEHVNSWLKVVSTADDQLRQRVAFALSQFFVVSDRSGLASERAALSNYYDLLIDNAFGNYRDLLEQVTLSPIMGDYLSMKGNQKPDPENGIRPDENFAREVLQLFSIGLVQLELDGSVVLDNSDIPVPTYDQETIEAFAHVFTGWHFSGVDNWNYPKNADWFSPMTAYPERHDTGTKTLLNGFELAANQTAEQDLQAALDNIFHHPNVAPFFAQHIIRQLITSNPSPEYIERVATRFNDDGSGTRGNIGAVVVAALTDTEALNGYAQNPETFGKLREPLIRLVSLWRAFDANPNNPEFNYTWLGTKLNQGPQQAPSVFNFFSPDFSQGGDIKDSGLKSPVFQIHNESSIIDITSRLLAHSAWKNTESTSVQELAPINISKVMLLIDNHEALHNLLGKLLLGAPPSAGLRAQADYMLEERKNGTAEVRAEDIIFLYASSPEAAVQR